MCNQCETRDFDQQALWWFFANRRGGILTTYPGLLSFLQIWLVIFLKYLSIFGIVSEIMFLIVRTNCVSNFSTIYLDRYLSNRKNCYFVNNNVLCPGVMSHLFRFGCFGHGAATTKPGVRYPQHCEHHFIKSNLRDLSSSSFADQKLLSFPPKKRLWQGRVQGFVYFCAEYLQPGRLCQGSGFSRLDRDRSRYSLIKVRGNNIRRHL